MDQLIQKGASLIGQAGKILIFTGAGLSTESGIPDFRSPGGLWDRYDPEEFYLQKIVSDDKCREKYWQVHEESYRVMKQALPNPGHIAIKELEQTGKVLAIVTQNIDRLHHRAGSSPDKILELHGTAFMIECLTCGRSYDRDVMVDRVRQGVKALYCDDCSGILKPATISFGQTMPEDKLTESFLHAQDCDLCIVLGTSLVVYPAASVPEQAVNSGAKLIIINLDITPLDSIADLVIHDSVGKVLGGIVDMVLERS
jgi:NAD-dependent deacetylase